MPVRQQVDMISVCGADGAIRPLRFRFSDEMQVRQVVDIAEVVSVQEISYVGIEGFLFVCRTFDGNREHLVEIRYAIRTHRWTLYRMIY